MTDNNYLTSNYLEKSVYNLLFKRLPFLNDFCIKNLNLKELFYSRIE